MLPIMKWREILRDLSRLDVEGAMVGVVGVGCWCWMGFVGVWRLVMVSAKFAMAQG